MAAPKAPTRIQKAGNGHSYFLDGEKVPGVTTILGNGIPKPALVGWAANTTADYVMNRLAVVEGANGPRIVADDLVEDLRRWNASRPGWAQVKLGADPLPRLDLAKVLANVRYKDLDEAANRGTEVHRLAEALGRGEPVEVTPALAGHVAAYVQFLDEWEPANARLEVVGINRRWRYMGKMDMIAEFPGKVWSSGPWQGQPVGRGLFDVKTARSGIFAEVALQLQGYRFCESILTAAGEEPMPPVDFVAAIHVRADGYDVIPFDVTADPNTDRAFRTFLYAKQVGEWLDFKEGDAARVKLDMADPPRPEGEDS